MACGGVLPRGTRKHMKEEALSGAGCCKQAWDTYDPCLSMVALTCKSFGFTNRGVVMMFFTFSSVLGKRQGVADISF